MRLILTYFVLLLFTSVCLAEEVHIVNSDITNFPERKVEFYYYDNDYNLINSISKDNIELKLNDINKNEIVLTPPLKIVPTPLSVVFSIDISENNKKNLPQIVSSILSLDKYLQSKNIEFAIQAYNSNSFILENFTTDQDKIQRALGTLEAFGFSNYNTAFTNNITGSIDVARKSKNNSIIINFASGKAIGDSNAIINKANSFGVSLYNILINKQVPKILTSIATRTGGKSYSTNTDNELLNALLEIVNNNSELDPFIITYNEENCDTTVRITLKLKPINILEEYIANYSKNKFPYIELEPEFIDFGIVESGESEIESFTLTARNTNLILENILPEYPELSISPNYKNILLQKNSPKSFNLEYNSSTTDYNFKQIEIISNACKLIKLDIFAGKKQGDVSSSELEILSPNGGEQFYTGQIVEILWEGVLSTQEVIIEFSTDAGVSWKTITENATGKKFKWIVPNFQSNKMLIRVEIANGDLNYKNINYVKDIDNNLKATNIVLSHTNQYAGISYDNGSIFVWDIDSNRIKTQLRNNNPGFLTTDLEFGINTNLFAAAFGKNNEFDVVIWDIDNVANTVSKSFDKIPTNLEWSDNGTSIFIGFEDGELIEWDMANNTTKSILDFGASILGISFNISNGFMAVSTVDKLLLLNDDFKRIDSINLTGISDIDWNESGNKLSIAYQSSDLRIYELDNLGGNFKLNLSSRINRPEKSNILSSSWADNNSVVIISGDSKLVEYWGIDNTQLFDFELHKKDLKLINSNGKRIISATDTNLALVWDIDDYPFDYNTLDSDISDNNWSIVKKAIQIKNQDFGILCLNTFYHFDFLGVITNQNSPTFTIDSIIPLSNDIVINNSFPIKLDKGESLDLSVNYFPKNSGPFQHSVFVYFGTNKEKIVISSNNKQPDYNIINNRVEFNNTIINSKKDKKVEVILNNSSTKMKFDEIELVFGSDYFNIENINKIELESGEKLIIDISFEPENEENINGLIKLTSKNLCNDVYISLFGNGIKNNLSFLNNYNLGKLSCTNTRDTTITIKNFSLDPIDIIGSKLKDNNSNTYTILNEDIPKSISIGDSANINVRFNTQEVGTFGATLEITTNLTGPSNLLEIGLNTIRDTINLDVLDDNLDFGTIGINEKGNKSIRVINNSLIDFTFPNEYNFNEFRLMNATPKTISTGDTSHIEFEFTGQNIDTTIAINLSFINGCNSNIIIPTFVDVSNGKPRIDVASEMNFGEIICDSIEIFDVEIKNTGKSNLKIEEVSFDGLNANQFAQFSDYKGLNIQPNKSAIIRLNYTPKNIGEINATLILNTNAENSTDGKSLIAIKLIQNKTQLQLLPNNVKFEGLKSNRKYSTEIKIKNLGNKISVPFYENDVRFYVDSIRPNIILPNEEASIFVTFVGGDPETDYFGEIQIVDECYKKYTIDLEANVGGSDFVSIKPEDIESKTGKMINLNISFENSTGITIPENDTIKTKLLFNSTLLVPLDDKYKGKIDGDGMRVIDLEFPLQDKEFIYHIPVIVTLGDTSYSEIRLEQSTHLNNTFYIDDVSTGSIFVTNIVSKPNDRFIDGNGKQYLSETIPSPITESGVINYGIIESTNVKITLYDILGNKVDVLVDKFHIPGEYSLEINPQSISSGNYLYKLETPSMEIIKKMTIVK